MLFILQQSNDFLLQIDWASLLSNLPLQTAAKGFGFQGTVFGEDVGFNAHF